MTKQRGTPAAPKTTTEARGTRDGVTTRVLRSQAFDRSIQFLGIGTFYVVILIFFSVSTPNFLQYSNGINILSNVSVIGIVAIGQSLEIISGDWDFPVS